MRVLIINFGIFLGLFLMTEAGLKVFAPFEPIATIGRTESENAKRYGWGFSPGETIKVIDPDKNTVYESKANSRGWRDVHHDFENPSKKLRILALGDSNTFGAIVSADQIYTRRLENLLNEAGIDAEVINMAYGRWSIDQEYEALVAEGLKYKPDFVIVQFCANDLGEIDFNESDPLSLAKPFWYTLENNQAVRKTNSRQQVQTYGIGEGGFKKKIKSILFLSEIFKRAHSYFSVKKFTASNAKPYLLETSRIEKFYKIFPAASEALKGKLTKYQNEYVNTQELHEIFSSELSQEQIESYSRIFENRWFNSPDHLEEIDMTSYGKNFPLYFAILEKVKAAADSVGAKTLILSDNEQGSYDWSVYWHRLKPTPKNRESFLSLSQKLREFAQSKSIGFIESNHRHDRARNDPHPNDEGNLAMAKNIYEYLVKSQAQLLDRFKKHEK